MSHKRENEAMARRSKAQTARAAVIAEHGRMPAVGSKIDCPMCSGKRSLRVSSCGDGEYKLVRCATTNCVSWVE